MRIGCLLAVLGLPAVLLLSLLATAATSRGWAAWEAPWAAHVQHLLHRGRRLVCMSEEPLQFLHIPKTAGQAIENAAMRTGVFWGRLLDNQWCYQGDRTVCSPWHVPPALLHRPSVYSGAETFCVVRHPLDRAVSQYSYAARYPPAAGEFSWLVKSRKCDAQGMNDFLRASLRLFNRSRLFHFTQDCHFVPQSEYIWGAGGDPAARQYCDHILRFEELPGAFNDLMQQKGYSARLPSRRDDPNDNRGVCALSRSDLEPDVRQLLLSLYADDFRLLKYSAEPEEREVQRADWRRAPVDLGRPQAAEAPWLQPPEHTWLPARGGVEVPAGGEPARREVQPLGRYVRAASGGVSTP